MTVIIHDRDEQRRIVRRRRALGLDRFDEVWDGVYVVSPLPNEVHQEIVGGLVAALTMVIRFAGLGKVFPGINVSDRVEGWKRNFRCPDVAVYLSQSPARSCGTHWVGGPDLAVEVVSPGDRSRRKLGFYARVGTRELLVVDREPWALELYRLQDGALVSVGTTTLERPGPLASAVVPLNFRLVQGPDRPMVEAAEVGGPGRWLA